MKHKHYFVTGTDTGIGKTYVTQQLMQGLKAQGKTVLGLKPIAAGGSEQGNEDALIYLQENSLALPYETINPYLFKAAVSPHIAARLEGRSLSAQEVALSLRDVLNSPVDHVLIEGAGGVCAPISERETMLDLMRALGFPVILVVGLRLGCLNHALLSAQVLREAGLTIAGWVGNPIDPLMEYSAENLETLRAAIGEEAIPSRHCEKP